MNKLITLLTFYLKRKGALARLYSQAHFDDWEKARIYFLDLNKSLITFSSSAIILSFTVVQIGRQYKIPINKISLEISWFLFSMVIFFGIFVKFLQFIYALSLSIATRKIREKKFKSKWSLFQDEILFLFLSRSLLFWISITQLFLFLLAILFLLNTANWTLRY